MRWEGVILWERHFAHVDYNEVASLGFRVRHVKLTPNVVEEIHLALHVGDALVPEAILFSLLES